MRDGVAVIVLDEPRRRVLLLQRGLTAPWMPGRWNLPGGGVEPGESATAAAVRETFEETALRVNALQFIKRVDRALDVFIATKWSGRVAMLDHEHTNYVWAPLSIADGLDLIPSHRAILLELFALGAKA